MGHIDYDKKTRSVRFKVSSTNDLKIVIYQLNKFPLITQKLADYELLKQIYYLMQRGDHLTYEGLRKIVAIRASMNQGLKRSPKLVAAFPNVVPVIRPKVKNKKLHDPNWLAGFATAEACFFVGITNSNTKLGQAVHLEFILSQHSRDELFMSIIIKYLECGYIKKSKTRPNELNYVVTRIGDITEKIIPFFKKHPILGVKSEDFKDFCQVAELIKEKKHLTEEGLEKIKQIKAGMNKGRKGAF